MNDLFIEYFYKKFEFRAGRINLISDYFFVWVGLPLLLVVGTRDESTRRYKSREEASISE